MANEVLTLWEGFDKQQVKGDDLGIKGLTAFPTLQREKIGQLINSQKPAIYYVNGQPVTTNTPTTTATTGFDLQSFVSNNKLIVFGGIALIVFLLMSRNGGGLLEATTVKRYAGRK